MKVVHDGTLAQEWLKTFMWKQKGMKTVQSLRFRTGLFAPGSANDPEQLLKVVIVFEPTAASADDKLQTN